MNKHYVIFDISNIARMAWHVNDGQPDDVVAGMAVDVTLKMLNKYYKKFKPHEIILAYDRPNWRVDYTKTPKCVSGKLYKGDRALKLTEKEKARLEIFKATLADFEELIKAHTSIICFSADGCEADDLIAGFCQKYGEDIDITIVSSDKDYVQLLVNDNIKLMNPLTQKYRTLEEWDNSIEWNLFVKCIRAGEDNIQSAYPRVRLTKLKEAFENPFTMTNIMKHEWKHPNGKKYVVEELFKENQYLMDLTKQPDHIKTAMFDAVEHGLDNRSKFSLFHFVKWCQKHNLKKIVQDIAYFKPMLTNNCGQSISGNSVKSGGVSNGASVEDTSLMPLVE